MTRSHKIISFAVILTFLILTPPAFADAIITLTGVGSGASMDGVYIGPYVATVNGVANTLVICDDYTDESFVPESWTAYSSTVAGGLTNVKFTSGNETQNYDEAIYLTLELLAAPAGSTEAGEIQYALWGVFDPSAITALTDSNSSYGAAAEGYLINADNNYSTLTTAQLDEFTIYTPDTNDSITCGSGTCAKTPPQEFIVADPTPESGTLILAALGIGLLLLVKRRHFLLGL